ncbi:MAG TPA: hypothetical protein VNO30_07495 [Kofleriaceae bacterium]|nr:hypothetical protein [Kofleriaceae bacterium]
MSRQIVAVIAVAAHVIAIAIAAAAAALTGCGGVDSGSGAGEAAPGPGAGSAGDEASPIDGETALAGDEAPRDADKAPPDAAYLVLRDKGLVAIEHGKLRTLVEDEYVGGRAMARKGGGLWFYVGDRMARYDGSLALLPDAPAKLGAVAVDPDGTLWVSGAGLASYDGTTWKRHALPPGLRNASVRSLVFAADGTRYGVADGVLVAGRGDTWTALTAGAPPVRDIALANDGTLYVSRRDQVARLAGGKLVPVATLKGDAPALVTTSGGTVHVFHRGGAHRITAGKLEPLADLPFTVGQVFGADGTLYGISADGLRIVRRHTDGKVDKLPANRDLPFKARSITVDAQQRIWVVLEHGITVLGRRGLAPLMPGDVPELSRDVEAIIVTGDGPLLHDIGDVQALQLRARFTSAIASAERLTLYEGLPHPSEERARAEAERRSKPVQELHGDWFYEEPLAPSAQDVKRLTQLLSMPATFELIFARPACCQFHPDYAVEWQQGSSVYRALLCFGCGEALLLGPGITESYQLTYSRELAALLSKYRKNRPTPPLPCWWLPPIQEWRSADELPWPAKLVTRNPWDLFLLTLECAQRGSDAVIDLRDAMTF